MNTKIVLQKLMVLFAIVFASSTNVVVKAQTDVTGYDTVTVSIPASAYNALQGAPQMARVKYNKVFPLVITSDDMGKTELTNNWAEVNGYPNINANVDVGIQPGGTDFLAAPYKKYYMQGESSNPDDYQPMTYTDNVGKTQRYRLTSAIMPYLLKADGSNDYSHIDANDAKLMLRTGWSFAQHDVNDISSVANISTAMTNNSNIWANKVGVGLKVMVEPNGNHNYLDAGRQNSGVCWNIFQNSTSEYPDNDKTIADWTDGIMPSTFSNKPTGGYIRSFFQGHETEWKSEVDGADGTKIVVGGTHGLGDEIKSHLRSASNVTNNAWVGSADEVWEYYHIYNNLQIENVYFGGGNLTFDVKVPKYKKNQYRELTLNIPGLTGTGAPTFSTANGKTVPVTGGYKIDGGTGIGYTMNIGLENSITTHIDELMAIYRDDQTNGFVKRDIQYLIDQLWDGSVKTGYLSQLDANPTYDLIIRPSLVDNNSLAIGAVKADTKGEKRLSLSRDNAISGNLPVLATIKTDTNGEKSFAVPRYIVSDDKLYETAVSESSPNYAKTVNTASASATINYTEKSIASLKVGDYTPKAVLMVEGEDMEGTTILGADLDLAQTSHGRYWAMALGSNGMAGNLVSGKTATVTSALPRGKYKAVIGYGETYKSQGTYNYNLLVDGAQTATVSTSSATNNAVTELTTAEFEVSADGQTITLTTDNTNAGSRWIDYIYFVQTTSLNPEVPSATLTSNISSNMKVNNSATLTATTGLNGGTIVSTAIYEADSNGTKTGNAVATSNTETVSYTFTPTTAGTYYFVSESVNSIGTTTSSLLTVTAVAAIDTYTLSIIDKSGNVALTTTVAASSLTDDPLPDAFRSPFAQNYKYYNTIAEAQANSGSNLANTSDWIQSTVYVGYDVDATKMAEGKVHAIWANGRYMHVIQNAGNSHNTQKSWHNAYSVQNQQYDVEGTNATRIGYSTGPYVQHGNISPTTLPFLDNSYMWELGTDPYNIKLKNKAYGFYQSSNAYNNQILYDVDEEASAETYCLLYWADKNGGNVDTSADYYRLMYKTDLTDDGVANKRTMYQWNNYWRINNDNSWNTNGKLYIKELPAININILNDAKEVECTLQGYFKSGATMPSDGTDNGTSYYTPFNLYRSYTSKHKWWYDAATTDAVSSGSAPDATKIENNGGNIYVTYTLDDVWGKGTFSDTKQPFHLYPSNGGTVYWYSVRLNPADSRYSWFLKANSDINQPLQNCNGTNLATSDYDSSHKEYYWAFKGTPYNLKIINMHHGDGYYLGVSKTATDIDAQTYLLPDTEDNNVTWEMTDGLSQNNMYPFFRLRASYNGENTSSANPLYISYNSSTPNNANLAKVAGGNQSIGLTEKATTDITKVSLTADAAPYYVDEAITLTATATPSPSGTDRVSSLVIEQEVEGVWTPVGTAYAGSDVAGVAEKDATTKTVTVTYEFTPVAEGTFNFRAHAVVDGEDQYSTAETTAGGDGDVVAITATVKQIEPKNSSYTLTLIDKGGNELITETSVPASRITTVNTLTNRNGDPFDNAYRSPLVTTYKYYEGTAAGKTSAQAANDENLVDWNNYEGTTVYVGYEVSDVIDLNYKDSNGDQKFSSLNDDANSLMKNRKARSASESTLVRDASKFGKMYLLKFKTNAAYYSENGSDRRESVATPSGSFVYPYTNGDGPIYVYDDARYQKQKDDGASTRTRWPWFLVSPNGDPYHVYITSWQNAHSVVTGKDANNKDVSTNYYSYLRTYYNSTTGTIVTNNVTDDPSTLDGSNNQILPTDYMILRGSGTDGLNYKLTTVATISDGTTTERRTVTSIEQYWRNNPTAQLESGGTKNETVVATDNAQLKGYGWHNYSAYVNAAKWDGTNYDNGKSKKYLNDSHWFQTISLGDGSLDIVEANIDGVLVLLDNHGWEIMRKPIVAKDDPDYETVRAALRKYDSPMVKQYKFYSTRNVKHKVAGYHKYDINRQTDTVTPTTPLTDAADRVDKDKTITSLADYEPHTSSGALTDLYVTYEVKDEYANSYTGAATEAATASSTFLLKQGSSYAKANGTAIESTSDASAAGHWKLKPNFNIDAEMGYCYDGSGNNYNNELTQAALETLYYNGGTDSRNGFDPYNIQIQNATTNTYFTTNASTATLDGGIWSGDGSTLSLQTIATRISPTGNDNKTLAVTNATFMAVQDQYGNMRLMPRFQHEQVVDNFATLADPATLSAYDATNAQTTQLTTPVTYHIIDNSGNDALQMTVTSGIGLSVPDALKSPMVSEYQFHSTQAHASAAETRATGDLTVAQEDVYVSYTVDASKMAASKVYAIHSPSSKNYMHAVFQTGQTGSQQSYHYALRTQNQDVNYGSNDSFTANTVTTENLPFVDDTYLWTLGDDPYHVTIANKALSSSQTVQLNSSNSTNPAVFAETANASTFCLLYWNSDISSPYCAFRYIDPAATPSTYTGETSQFYLLANNNQYQLDNDKGRDAQKFIVEELPEVNVNVVSAGGTVEYTLKGHYKADATVPAATATPYFLQRAYTGNHTYYYTLADAQSKENAMTAGSVPVAETMENNKTDGKYNIYVRYDLDANWNTSSLFKVSTTEDKHWYFLKGGYQNQNLYTTTEKKVNGSASVADNTAKWALSGTPYALRIENKANEGYMLGIAADATSASDLMVYNEGDYIFDWELRFINYNNLISQTPALMTCPVIMPQGAVSQESPILYVEANGSSGVNWQNTTAAHFTFGDAQLVTLVIVDKSGGEAISEDVDAAAIAAANGDPLSAALRSPFATNFKYYDNATDAQNNSGENTVADLTTKLDDTVYVGYDVKTVEDGGLDFSGKTGYTIRANNRYLHAAYNPGDNHSTNRWLLDNQNKDYGGATGNSASITAKTFPIIDNTYVWLFEGDPYDLHLKNKSTGKYVLQSTNQNKNYQVYMPTNDDKSSYCLLYYTVGQGTYYALYNRDYSNYIYMNAGSDGGSWRLDPKRQEGQIYIAQPEQVNTNIVNPRSGEVECVLQTYYNDRYDAQSTIVPYYLLRSYTSDHTMYYTLADANEGTNAASTITYSSIADGDGDGVKDIYVGYTLDSGWKIPETSDGDSFDYLLRTSASAGAGYWHSVKTARSDARYLKADNNSGELRPDGTAPAVTEETETAAISVDDKCRLWAFEGSPYNLKLHNMGIKNKLLGVAHSEEKPAANNDPIKMVSPSADGVVYTWELVHPLNNSNNKTTPFIRLQKGLNGEVPLLYLSDYQPNPIPVTTGSQQGGGSQLVWTYLKHTTGTDIHFHLYDRDGNSMNLSAEADQQEQDADLMTAFLLPETGLARKFCTYEFYTSSDFAEEHKVTTVDREVSDIYVKWDYTDDAPVFSQPGGDSRDYQYYMLGVWGFSNYNLMDVEGEGTTESPYTFKPNNTVGTPRDLKHQFALVGNPYGFKLYNRAANKDIKRNAALEITFADYETDGTTPTEEITFDLPIVSGSAYTSTETHFRSTKTGRYLSVTGTNENKSFSMTDNALGYTRFRYIIVPVRVFKEGAVSSTAEKDYRMYALEMNPSNTARTTDARITTNDLRATGNAIGNARDFNHAFCNYTYYQKYDWNTSVSAPVPDDGLSYYGGKDQNKRQFIATYTVDQDAFERLYYLDNSPHHGNAYSSKGAENAGSYTTQSDSRLDVVKADVTDIYRWRFTGDPYDLQIHNVNTDKQSEDYVLAVKTLTADSNTAPTDVDGTLALVTKDVKDGDSDTESYGQYSHWEIIKRSDNYYVFWNIETPERYTYSLTSQANKLNKNNLYVTVPPFKNNSTTVLNINQVEWNLVDVFNHYNVTWHVMEKTGESTYTEVARDTKVVDENVTLTIEDLPTSVKRHFCDYEKMYSDAACTTEITEHTVNAATDIYVPYTLDSGAPDFITEADVPSNIVEKNWYEIGFGCPNVSYHIYYNATTDKMDRNSTSTTDAIRDLTDYQNYRWALVGTPYGVKFYNKVAGTYLTSDGVPGNTTTLSSSGTTFDLVDDFTGEFCAIFDAASGTYLNASAQLQTNNNSEGSAAEFSNTYGVVKVAFVLHYSEKTLRSDKADKTIQVDTYQKLGKSLDDVLPEKWKRAFCKYTYHWDAQTTETATATSTVETVSQAMVDAYNARRTEADPYLYVHVTYDFETNAPFKWSTADKEYTGKHWYYLVNNHRPNGELGKMVFRDSGPKLRVSTALKENQLYLNNFEWCVIGDPYGFKMLNRYDPDQRYDEYIRVMDYKDGHGDGYQIEQNSNDSQNIFEMMPGQYSYNFWMHPVYTEDQITMKDEFGNPASVYEYVGNNYNGSAAIIPNDQRSMTYLKTNSAANFRLEIQSDATLSEYVKYAGFVGGLKYDKVTDVMRTDAADGDLSDEDKQAVRDLIDNPENIVQMAQGYYRIVPSAQEDGSGEHKYIRGYLDDRERTGSDGYNRNLKVETQTAAEYDPASIFWFEGTTDNGYPRYFIKTQGLSLDHTGLNPIDAETNYKCRYENLGAAITQIKVASLTGDMPHNYISVSTTSTEATTDQCFDEQNKVYKTRLYLQKVGEANDNELPFKMKMNELFVNYPDLHKSYASFYVPFDVQIPDDCDVVPFYGVLDMDYPSAGEGQDRHTLRCQTLDYINEDYGEKFIPANTPVIMRSESATTEFTFSLPNDAPTSDEALAAANKIEGIFLSKVITDADLYTFGREKIYSGYTGTVYEDKYTGRVGFFRRSNVNKALIANRVFYHSPFYNPQDQSSDSFVFTFNLWTDEDHGDDVTNIRFETKLNKEDSVYDLQGRKIPTDQLINGQLPKGIYIINGKKRLVK